MTLSGLHDASSRWLFGLAGVALALAVALYVMEVVLRYAFSAPTTWSGEVVQYMLAITIFCGLPEITRRTAHVAIDILPDALPKPAAVWHGRMNMGLATLTCGAASCIVAREAFKQFERGLMTNAAHPIPRWWLTALIALGLVSAALHFARRIREGRG